jgi:hypothetical protein
MPHRRGSVLLASLVTLAVAAPAHASGPGPEVYWMSGTLLFGVPAAVIGFVVARAGGTGPGMRMLRGLMAAVLAVLAGTCGFLWVQIAGTWRALGADHMIMLLVVVSLLLATSSCIRGARKPPPRPT